MCCRGTVGDIIVKFLLLGAAAFVAGWVYSSCFKITGFRQAGQWRKYYLKAILRQDIEWFDTNNVKELPSDISDTTQKIEVRLCSENPDVAHP